MRDLFRKIRKMFYEYKPLVEVCIFRQNIEDNIDVYQKMSPGLEIWPVLKSNAYGHGLVEVAKIVDRQSDCLVVDSFYEALILRNEKIKSKILVIGYTFSENIVGASLKNIVYTITSLDGLRELDSMIKKKTVLNLKFNTGMNRQGLEEDEFDEAMDIISNNANMVVEGICSHLADADNKDSEFTLKQISKWNRIVARAKKEINDLKYWHLSATEGTRYVKNIEANVMRLGLGMYGYSENTEIDNFLKPSLEIRTVITSIREIIQGERIGYGGTFCARKNTKIATLPVGYYEALNRRLSNKGFVAVGGKMVSILGRVSMNISTIDITDCNDCKIGDEVIVVGTDKKKSNSIAWMANCCQTIPYELLVKIPAGLRRKII